MDREEKRPRTGAGRGGIAQISKCIMQKPREGHVPRRRNWLTISRAAEKPNKMQIENF